MVAENVAARVLRRPATPSCGRRAQSARSGADRWPDPLYLAVGGEFEDHCVSELQRPDCTVAHHHTHRV